MDIYNIIPLVLILIGLGVIIVIFLRRFPALATLDIENMPAEKEEKFKERIISDRIKTNTLKFTSKIFRIFRPVKDFIFSFFKSLYNKLHSIKEEYKSEAIVSRGEEEAVAVDLIAEASEMIDNEEFEEAEKKLIKSISLDNKNLEAFKLLGHLYYEEKSYKEAKETFEHVLKIEEEEDAEVYYDLSLVNQAMDDFAEASKNIERALSLSPNNPRYLDMMFNISIINKDKDLAEAAYNKLSEVNPENEKLPEMKEDMEELQ